MYYKCFKCLREIDGSIKQFCLHLKHRHCIYEGTHTRIICSQNGCQSIFLRLSSFKRHLQRKHANAEVNQTDEHEHTQENIDMVQEHSVSDREDEDMENEGAEDEATSPSFDDIRESIVVFVAKLKLSTSIPDSFVDSVIKDVADITNSLIDTFIHQIMNFKEQAKNIGNIEQNILQQMLQNLQKVLLPFSGLMTEHQRKDYFTSMEHLYPPKKSF